MAILTSPLFSRTENDNGDEEQLLKLFWNRAELKKELAKLRRDALRSAEKLTQQEALTLRLQQRLEQLESQLGNPETASSVVTYYQLQGVWKLCHNKLLAASNELGRAQHDKQYRKHVAEFRRGLNASLSGVQKSLNEVNHSGEVLSEEIRKLREKRSASYGIWNIFRRRRLTAQIRDKRLERRAITMRLGELTEELQSRSSQEPPEFSGLGTETKRAINLRLIAYAQELYLHFADREIANLARESSIRGFDDLKFGNKRDCRAIGSYIEDQLKLLAADANMQMRVQARMEYLKSELHYRQDADAVPIAGTLNSIPVFRANGKKVANVAVNVLGDEYWDIFSALLT
ncbi:MAG: hypothetical protein QF790_00415 [Gammaproteobacteria bacterium]|jgi:hypothetical protein|nr:hypothetical protein [Gammaproteobacteria bacterium]MDP6615617.1 hypothetical protein [Gammaproteobacteria bacterium]MDP6695864.1 hypothetical protein [Gammaproteobacteria bacterium]